MRVGKNGFPVLGKQTGIDALAFYICPNFSCKLCRDRKLCKDTRDALNRYFDSPMFDNYVKEKSDIDLFNLLCFASGGCKKCPASRLCNKKEKKH